MNFRPEARVVTFTSTNAVPYPSQGTEPEQAQPPQDAESLFQGPVYPGHVRSVASSQFLDETAPHLCVKEDTLQARKEMAEKISDIFLGHVIVSQPTSFDSMYISYYGLFEYEIMLKIRVDYLLTCYKALVNITDNRLYSSDEFFQLDANINATISCLNEYLRNKIA